MSKTAYVFGYGSLAAVGAGPAAYQPTTMAHVSGLRRTWNVAMENGVTLPEYKYYLDPRSGERPQISVTFLNLLEAEDQTVNGTLIPVDETDLEALDRRERNYERVDVTERLVEPMDGPVWAYFGTPAARMRFDDALAQGRAVVDRGYRQSVEAYFQSLGDSAYARYLASTDQPRCPARELRRVDL